MTGRTNPLEAIAAWLLALLWLLPLLYAFWSALHPAAYATSFSLSAPWTLENFARAWHQAPFGRYYINTVLLVGLVLAGQLVLATLAAYAFARFTFKGSGIVFALVLLQLMIMPDVLIVENYRAIGKLGLLDTIPAIALPYLASAFGIFLLRQTFKSVPQELVEAARVEGAGALQILWKVYVPLARPTYIAFGLVSVSYHWNNLLWPLIVTNSTGSRPLTVGLAVFGAPETGVDWSIINAATVMTMAPLLIGFLLFQRQFVQSFMRAQEFAEMQLVTWNIQYGKGCDGIVDLARIAATARALADADVYCFQEISCFFAKLDDGTDQSAAIAALFPDHRAVYRPAVEITGPDGQIRSFGNLTLSRLPVLQIANHLLPLPDAGRDRGMRRQALEVTVAAPFGPVRIVNTHLEFFSATQREAQVARLLDLQQEASTSPKPPSPDAADAFAGVAAASSILCGDFNFDVSDSQHMVIHGAARPGLNYRDAWTIAHPGVPHVPTCGLYDRELWTGPDCRDFIFVSEDMMSRVTGVTVDGDTDASDHQPVLIELND